MQRSALSGARGRVRTRVAQADRSAGERTSAGPKLHSLGALLAEIKTEDPTGLFVWRDEEEEVGGAVDRRASRASLAARVAHIPPALACPPFPTRACPGPPPPHPTPQAPIWEHEERFRRTPLMSDDLGHVEPPPAMFAPPAEEEPLPNNYSADSGFREITPEQLVAAREDGSVALVLDVRPRHEFATGGGGRGRRNGGARAPRPGTRQHAAAHPCPAGARSRSGRPRAAAL